MFKQINEKIIAQFKHVAQALENNKKVDWKDPVVQDIKNKGKRYKLKKFLVDNDVKHFDGILVASTVLYTTSS